MSTSFHAFVDELTKIAEMSAEQKQRVRRYLADAAVGAVGFGAGYGIGSAAGRLLADGKPSLVQHKYAPLVLGGLSAGGALLARHIERKRQEYRDEPINSVGNR